MIVVTVFFFSVRVCVCGWVGGVGGGWAGSVGGARVRGRTSVASPPFRIARRRSRGPLVRQVGDPPPAGPRLDPGPAPPWIPMFPPAPLPPAPLVPDPPRPRGDAFPTHFELISERATPHTHRHTHTPHTHTHTPHATQQRLIACMFR